MGSFFTCESYKWSHFTEVRWTEVSDVSILPLSFRFWQILRTSDCKIRDGWNNSELLLAFSYFQLFILSASYLRLGLHRSASHFKLSETLSPTAPTHRPSWFLPHIHIFSRDRGICRLLDADVTVNYVTLAASEIMKETILPAAAVMSIRMSWRVSRCFRAVTPTAKK